MIGVGVHDPDPESSFMARPEEGAFGRQKLLATVIHARFPQSNAVVTGSDADTRRPMLDRATGCNRNDSVSMTVESIGVAT
jgi:hypothetical protein